MQYYFHDYSSVVTSTRKTQFVSHCDSYIGFTRKCAVSALGAFAFHVYSMVILATLAQTALNTHAGFIWGIQCGIIPHDPSILLHM